MSAIRERTRLYLVDLPKKLTSRRNFHAYFSKFGEVKKISVNKDVKSGMVQFSTNFEAQSAKTQGKIYEGQPLNMFWSENTVLDPRAKKEQDNNSIDNSQLWKDDDKECFGIESAQTNSRDELRQLAKKSLNLSRTKQRVSFATDMGRDKIEERAVSLKSQEKLVKIGTKPSVVVRKSILGPTTKRKILRKEENTLRSIENKQRKAFPIKKVSSSKLSASNTKRLDLKTKLALLDERDKEIRKGMVQDSNINTAVAIKGTCPDMCPERERIQRQLGHAIAIYEMKPGTYEMDENRAVKEYSRSSADQEVPLPHDLRPEPVLSMTMNYLITNIFPRVDDPDENKAQWYSFCWNRLRSIRKDIIMQQLYDLETVKIVEQCARYHICCYDHMWGAEIGGFDDTLNTKILIDCLQSLKQMYEDLAKQGVRCSNEPEFYSYLILLKLTSGDVMWEYQQYSLNIQLSPEIQFAVQAYTAFKNNMYSRYFNLVKKASYLTACLMQRYFNEVRTQALKTMLKAYCLPNKNVGLLSSFIVSSLKFDSTMNALKFCEREEVDVKVDSDVNEDECVSTSSFLIREKRPPIANVIVGENNPIPPYTTHDVSSSFDDCGKLTSSPNILSDEHDEDLNVNNEITTAENEHSDIAVSTATHQSTFKFSLSPTNEAVNFFGNSRFSTGMSVTSHQPENVNFLNVDGIKKTNIVYDESSINTKEFKEDPEEEMVCENSEILQKPISNIFPEELKSENKLTPKSQFGFNQSLTIPSFQPMNKSNIFSTRKDNEVLGKQSLSFTTINDSFGIKDDNVHNSNFTSSSLTNQTKKVNSENVSVVKKDLLEETNCHLESNTFKQNAIEDRLIDTQYNLISGNFKPIDISERPQTTNDNNEEIQLAKEKEFKALLLEQLLKEKAEQEKQEQEKLEEHQRLDRIKKEKEKKDYYQSLRKDLSQRYKVINARKYARQWRLKIEKIKITRADFPLLFQLSVKDHISKWGSKNSIPTDKIFLRAKDKKNTVRIISQLLNSGITDVCRYIGGDLAERLAKSAAKTMKRGTVIPLYWKLVISVPWAENASSLLSVFNQLMRRWCKQSFYKQEGVSLGSIEHVVTSLEIPVNMSIHLSDTVQSSHDLQGMDALVFVIVSETESDEKCIKRLRNLVSSQIKSDLSIVIMNIGRTTFENTLEMELQQLQEQNIIAHWKICTWSDPKSIVDGLHFLADQVNVAPHIATCSLEMLIKQVSEDFFDMLSCSQHRSEALSNALKKPNNVIYIYNICLTKVGDLLKNNKLEKYFNFAEEFRPHIPINDSGGPELLCGEHFDDVYKQQVTKLINCLKLPEFTKWPIKSSNRLVETLKAYCIQMNDVGIFPQIVRMLDLPDGDDIQQHLQQVSWLYIVEIWAQCKIRDVLSSKDRCKRQLVVFNKNHVQRLIKDPWWLKLPIVVEQK